MRLKIKTNKQQTNRKHFHVTPAHIYVYNEQIFSKKALTVILIMIMCLLVLQIGVYVVSVVFLQSCLSILTGGVPGQECPPVSTAPLRTTDPLT